MPRASVRFTSAALGALATAACASQSAFLSTTGGESPGSALNVTIIFDSVHGRVALRPLDPPVHNFQSNCDVNQEGAQ
jgi:hypothetical protein